MVRSGHGPQAEVAQGLDLDLSLNSEVNIKKGWKENGGTKWRTETVEEKTTKTQHTGAHAWMG